MKYALYVPVLLALLVGSASAELKKCPAGYENQMMDRDTLGYCTRVPSLTEQADRAEAFVTWGLPALKHIAHHFQEAKRRGDVSECDNERYQELLLNIEHVEEHSLQFFDPNSSTFHSPDAERLEAALKKIHEAVEEAAKQAHRYHALG